jgi:hypothetical protein
MSPALYLADTSGLFRLLQAKTEEAWDEQLAAGRHPGQPARAALTLALSKGPGSAVSSSFQYSTGLSPLKDRQQGTASPGVLLLALTVAVPEGPSVLSA